MSANMTQTLTDLFQDLFAFIPANSTVFNPGRNPGDEAQLLYALKEQTMKNMSPDTLPDFETLVKVFDGVRSKLNLTVVNPEASCTYCDGSFRDVITGYNRIHGYISLLVCVFGSLANALNVAVLTRRDMATAPINRLLKWLAVADVFVMLEYVPFAAYKYFILPGQLDFPYSWAVYLLFHMHFAQILHTASICLTLSLAVWRYLAINYSDKSHILCTERRCSLAIVSSFLIPPVLCIPTFMVFDIHTTVVYERSVPTLLYHVDSDYEGALYQLNFWVHAVAVKLLPCFILTVISVWLIRALYSANKRQKNLRAYSACPGGDKKIPLKSDVAIRRQHKADKRTDRTTKMLLAVLLLFLVTELPQGILGLLSGLLGRCFFKRCYDLFGELMDILALINGAINFVLYCSMSRQFRLTFGMMLRPKLGKWSTPLAPMVPMASHSDVQNTLQAANIPIANARHSSREAKLEQGSDFSTLRKARTREACGHLSELPVMDHHNETAGADGSPGARPAGRAAVNAPSPVISDSKHYF